MYHYHMLQDIITRQENYYQESVKFALAIISTLMQLIIYVLNILSLS